MVRLKERNRFWVLLLDARGKYLVIRVIPRKERESCHDTWEIWMHLKN